MRNPSTNEVVKNTQGYKNLLSMGFMDKTTPRENPAATFYTYKNDIPTRFWDFKLYPTGELINASGRREVIANVPAGERFRMSSVVKESAEITFQTMWRKVMRGVLETTMKATDENLQKRILAYATTNTDVVFNAMNHSSSMADKLVDFFGGLESLIEDPSQKFVEGAVNAISRFGPGFAFNLKGVPKETSEEIVEALPQSKRKDVKHALGLSQGLSDLGF